MKRSHSNGIPLWTRACEINAVLEVESLPGVECLGHGVPVLFGLVVLEWDLCDVATDVDLSDKEDLLQVFDGEAKQSGQVGQDNFNVVGVAEAGVGFGH